MKNNFIDISRPMNYTEMMQKIECMLEKYSFLSFNSIGETILGKTIPLLSFGEGKKSVLYIGAHRATDWKISNILIKFTDDICRLIHNNSTAYGYDIVNLMSMRNICIIPMLNPDGVDYNINGIEENNPLYERVLSMNNMKSDFSEWTSNARGVELEKNYVCLQNNANNLTTMAGREGEWSESEPEIGGLCNYLRYNINIKAILSLNGTVGNSFYHMNIVTSGNGVANKICKILGISEFQDGYEAINHTFGLGDWCLDNIGLPVFDIMIQSGKESITYPKLKETLFKVPTFL